MFRARFNKTPVFSRCGWEHSLDM